MVGTVMTDITTSLNHIFELLLIMQLRDRLVYSHCSSAKQKQRQGIATQEGLNPMVST